LEEIGLDKEYHKLLIFIYAVCKRPARLASKTRERDKAPADHVSGRADEDVANLQPREQPAER